MEQRRKWSLAPYVCSYETDMVRATRQVRWEAKQTTPFIRTREFLWQEGHTYVIRFFFQTYC